MTLPFLEQLGPEDREALLATGSRRRLARGALLFVEGHRSDRVVIVLEGRVKIFSASDDGRETMLAARGPGEILGDMSAIDGHPHSASAVAVEPVLALVIPAASFRSFLETHERASSLLLRTVTARLRQADRTRMEFASYDAIGRVCTRLLDLAEKHGEPADSGGTRITLPLSQEELAAWTGSSREAVSKALRVLRERGWIMTHRRAITVIDRAALARRAR